MGSSWADEKSGISPDAPDVASRATLVRPAESPIARPFRVVVLVEDELGPVAIGTTDLEAEDASDALRVVRELGGVAADADPLLLVGG